MNYSPLRYPGGKAKLAPYIKFIIDTIDLNVETYIEPFVGGAGVALDLLITGVVDNIVINDFDKAIYSFWRAVVEDTKALITLIEDTDVTIDEWYRQKEIYTNCSSRYSIELAFATFYLNRTNRSGILNAGPIGGYSQQGNYLIDARYNKKKAIEKINEIAKLKKHIKVYNKEVRRFIEQVISKYGKETFVYFDPPYFNKGHRLYKNYLILKDHQEIAKLIKNNIAAEWIITYDNVNEIKEIYLKDFIKTYEFSYSIVRSNVQSEIVIFKHKELCPDNQQTKNAGISINFI